MATALPLDSGARFGAYVIEAAIGARGMGEVYRTRDTRLNPDVELKVLPELLRSDPERVQRFVREAVAHVLRDWFQRPAGRP